MSRIKKQPSLLQTPRYSVLQGFYCTMTCTASTFGIGFMLNHGISINRVGYIMAFVSIFTVIIQFLSGLLVGDGKPLGLKSALALMSGVTIVASMCLFVATKGSSPAALVAFYMVSAVLTASMQPLVTSIAMEFLNRGYQVNFGLARGIGSVAYAAAAFFLGKIVALSNEDFLPPLHVAITLVTLVFILLFPKPKALKGDLAPVQIEAAAQKGKTPGFISRHKSFCALLLGVGLITLGCRMVGVYLLNIIIKVGGNSGNYGAAAAIAALVEFPMMAGYSALSRRINPKTLLKISVIGYTAKSAAIIFARNIPMIYLAHCIQFFGYALFLPSFTFYINEIMGESEKIRGQTLGVSAMTAGDVLGALLCGALPASMGMTNVLLLGLGISSLGSVIAFIIVGKTKEKPSL